MKLKAQGKMKKTSGKTKKNVLLGKKNKKRKSMKEVEENGEEQRSLNQNESESEEGDNENFSSDEEDFKSHKKQLAGLKNTDPDFYKYLQEHDKDLLNFNDSESDSDNDGEKLHVPPSSLEVASDESDYEVEEEEGSEGKKKSSNVITLKMVAKWQEDLKVDKTSDTLRDVVEAFHAALLRVTTDGNVPSKYKVTGASVFNAIVRMCVIELPPALRLVLNLHPNSREVPTKNRRWLKVKSALKIYLTDLYELCAATSPSMLTVLLKHIHQMIPFMVCYSNISLKILKRVINLWSSDDDVLRVLSFLCALRIVNYKKELFQTAIKSMYMTYVRNTKFISPNTLPGVNFMRKSLAEMFALNETLAYQHAFLYIRQLAIHLRNAVTLKKKESSQAVYNWQFISSLQLWAELFGIIKPNSPLQSLVYPLVQIIIGTIKLIPSAQYFPLRFHCCKILISLSERNGVFIPVLPFLTEVLRDFDFNRKHKKASLKPIDFTCILRCSKVQMTENGFKDAAIECIYNLMIEYLASESHRISFPDTLVPAVMQMKEFTKKCRNVSYTKKIKAVLEKISENSRFIENERKKSSLKLDDQQSIEVVELRIKNNGTPFLSFFKDWKKIYEQKIARRITNTEDVSDFNIPVIRKFDKKRSLKAASDGPPELFPSDEEDLEPVILNGVGNDDDDDDEEETSKEPKRKKVKKVHENGVGKKKNLFIAEKQKEAHAIDEYSSDDASDVVEDLNLNDFN